MSTNAGFIEGIVLFYKGTELVEMSTRAAKFHGEKAETYRRLSVELRKLKSGETENLSDEAKLYNMKSSGNTYDPATQAENDGARHERQKRFHEHAATHYNKDATYGLSKDDLMMFGLSTH